ncbi:MAG: phosphonate ABC transporter, permease protein PhnE [Phycisphaerales bacterium]|nr:phosphonate ABC transporter, permease protein PhnE [Phycisphaerales bacterium]
MTRAETTQMPADLQRAKDPELWKLRRPLGVSTVAFVLIALALLTFSGQRLDLHEGVVSAGEGVADAVGLRETSEFGRGFRAFFDRSLPPVISDREELALSGHDRESLPTLARIESEPRRRYDPASGTLVEGESIEVVVYPLGYLGLVFQKMLETIEIGIWGTLVAVVLALPLALFATRGFSPHPALYHLARSLCSLSRSMPDIILAMLFVLLLGFGPMAGVMALGIHTAGFLGKFFADDIENADKGPQDAIAATGAGRIAVLRYAVLPQILPQAVAYVQYILERNVRAATVLGIVGAGGIGVELKGKWDQSMYGHVTTILLAIFVTVVVLEAFAQRLRRRLV